MRVPEVLFYLFYDFAGYVPFYEKNQESKGLPANAAKTEKNIKKERHILFFCRTRYNIVLSIFFIK